MENKPNYIKWLRSKVGHEKSFLSLQVAVFSMIREKCCFKKEPIVINGVFPVVQSNWVKHHRWQQTGLDVEVSDLIGIYTEFNVEYPNGDKAQSICIAYELRMVGGHLSCDKDETLELKYFPLNDTPELFCKQHEELMRDIKSLRGF